MTKIGFWHSTPEVSRFYGLNKISLIASVVIVPIIVIALKIIFSPLQADGISLENRNVDISKYVLDKKINIGTYNILFPQRAANNNSLPPFSTGMGYDKNALGQILPNTESRIKIITCNLDKAQLDVVCIQEMTMDMHSKIGSSLSEKYGSVYAKHKLTAKAAYAHGVAVFYDKTRFKLLNQRVLNNTFKTIDCTNPNNSFNNDRSAVLVDLKDKTTKKVIRVVSGHFFDPSSFREDKEQYVNWVVSQTEKCPSLRFKRDGSQKAYQIHSTVIAGDMNQDQYGDRPASEYAGDRKAKPLGVSPSAANATVFKPLFSRGYNVDGNLNSSEFWKDLETGKIHSKQRKIDWIFVKGSRPEYYPIEDFDRAGSDHTLVASSIDLK